MCWISAKGCHIKANCNCISFVSTFSFFCKTTSFFRKKVLGQTINHFNLVKCTYFVMVVAYRKTGSMSNAEVIQADRETSRAIRGVRNLETSQAIRGVQNLETIRAIRGIRNLETIRAIRGVRNLETSRAIRGVPNLETSRAIRGVRNVETS